MAVSNFIDFFYKRIRLTVLIFLLLTTFIILFIFNKMNRENFLEIIYLDIGQGDSILIKESSGLNFLIDTGSHYLTSQKVEKELTYFNKEIDSVMLTHPDTDHSGGLLQIKESLPVKNVFISKESDYSKYIKDTEIEVSPVRTFDNLILSDKTTIKVLSPEKGMTGEENRKSIVNTLTYGNFNFIFTGDADSETERMLVSRGYFDKKEDENMVNILKVGHHGSKTSSSEVFLKKIKPQYCIISVGRNNSYGHPDKDIVKRLEKYCKNIYRTDLNGNIYFKTEGKNLKIRTEVKK